MGPQKMLMLLCASVCVWMAAAQSNATEEVIDECGAPGDGEYDQPMHIGAAFIIFGTSLTGALLPILTQHAWPQLDPVLLACGKLFGAGVILATAFVHMFPEADHSLTDPCLSAAFTEDYAAYAGLFALLTIIIVHCLQVTASVMVQDHLHAKRALSQSASASSKPGHPLTVEPFEAETTLGQTAHTKDASGDFHHIHPIHRHGETDTGHSHALLFDARIEKRIGMFILEAGIACHSIIIGIALGVETEKFNTLLAALVFHQFFEGLALSTVVLEGQLRSKLTVFLMLLFYSLTTPVGVAIGIGIHSTYSESNRTTLLVQGVLEAIAAGILIYDSLVNIITPHFACPLFRDTTPLRRLAQIIAFWVGTGVMALLGRWA